MPLLSAAEDDRSRGQMLWWLVFGRLALSVFLLFLSGLPWNRNSFGASQLGALPIFVAVVTLSLVYVIALRVSQNFRLQSIVQLSIDLLLLTWLVWVTGDVSSPFVALYIIYISVASIILGPRGAIISAAACAATFTLLSGFTAGGLLPHFIPPPTETPLLKAIQTIGLNDVAFLVVGLLAAQLAERQSSSDVRLIATAQTLASLRALHERIVESIRSGLVTTDLGGRIYTINAAAEEITGCSAADVRGQEATIFFDGLHEQIEESLNAAAEGVTSPRYESDCLTADGLRIRLGYSIFPLFSESGETSGLVITFQDLTQIRTLEATTRRQDRLAAVGRMAASIAHEIRNPLAAIRGSIQVLRSEMEADSTQAQLMEIVLNESDRLNKIITDYLTYARPRSNTLADVDICEALKETFTLLRHDRSLISEHNIDLIVPEGPINVHADAAQLKQVFWNLARNAIQAMSGGGTFQAEVERRPGKRVRATFSDTGCGMSPDQVENLFEPFTSTTGGTGLGLSIVYQIIREHGGTINVRSREGQGTTITIDLPTGR
jgi:two-component system sensor histidine kinase PilS (NtrC family)